ncbi:pentapeptide repeat-containing protein [Parasphingorhabdus pacifica]
MPLVVHIALMLAMAVVLAIALGSGLWWSIGQPSVITGKPWTAKESFDFVKIILALVGGIGAVVALVVSYRKQRLGETAEKRQKAAESREDARLFGEDFAKATEQLGSTEAPVRLAGMYTLERLAQNTPHQQQTIVNVLCAYLRMPYTPPDSEPAEEHRQENERRKHEREVRLTAQRILATNLRPRKTSKDQADEHWRGIHLDLTGATLLDFDLHECQLDKALFTGAQFKGDASFAGAQFSRDTRFDGAQFSKIAWFSGAQFSGDAWFSLTQFSKVAWFRGAQFSEDAIFPAVQFSKDASFRGTQFSKDASFNEIRVRLDVTQDVLSNRTWPQGYVVTACSEDERLPDGEEQWRHLARVDTEENDAHPAPMVDSP